MAPPSPAPTRPAWSRANPRLGFQFFPGKTESGEVARGDAILGVGNNRWDPRWLWDKE